MLLRFGVGMREPVTMICWPSGTSAGAGAAAGAVDCAKAVDAPANTMTPQIMVDASKRSRVVWIFIFRPLQALVPVGALANCECAAVQTRQTRLPPCLDPNASHLKRN